MSWSAYRNSNKSRASWNLSSPHMYFEVWRYLASIRRYCEALPCQSIPRYDAGSIFAPCAGDRPSHHQGDPISSGRPWPHILFVSPEVRCVAISFPTLAFPPLFLVAVGVDSHSLHFIYISLHSLDTTLARHPTARNSIRTSSCDQSIPKKAFPRNTKLPRLAIANLTASVPRWSPSTEAPASSTCPLGTCVFMHVMRRGVSTHSSRLDL